MTSERVLDLQTRVSKGAVMLAGMTLDDPHRSSIVALLQQRQAELAQAERDDAGTPSLNCVVCGRPVHGNDLLPGHWTHLECCHGQP
jgi:hypothetical protein